MAIFAAGVGAGIAGTYAVRIALSSRKNLNDKVSYGFVSDTVNRLSYNPAYSLLDRKSADSEFMTALTTSVKNLESTHNRSQPVSHKDLLGIITSIQVPFVQDQYLQAAERSVQNLMSNRGENADVLYKDLFTILDHIEEKAGRTIFTTTARLLLKVLIFGENVVRSGAQTPATTQTSDDSDDWCTVPSFKGDAQAPIFNSPNTDSIIDELWDRLALHNTNLT